MKRKFMFRAWDSKYKVMLGMPFSIIGETTLFGGIENYLHEQSLAHKDETPSLLRLNDVVIMQSTGLIDKSGKEIFEGDIITHSSSPYPCQIVYKQSQVQFMACEITDSFIKCWQIKEKKVQSVIGNIYENSELL